MQVSLLLENVSEITAVESVVSPHASAQFCEILEEFCKRMFFIVPLGATSI